MTLKEFRELTKDLPEEMEMIIQKDSEGNGYSPLSGIDDEAIYVAENTYSGEVYSTTNFGDGEEYFIGAAMADIHNALSEELREIYETLFKN